MCAHALTLILSTGSVVCFDCRSKIDTSERTDMMEKTPTRYPMSGRNKELIPVTEFIKEANTNKGGIHLLSNNATTRNPFHSGKKYRDYWESRLPSIEKLLRKGLSISEILTGLNLNRGNFYYYMKLNPSFRARIEKARLSNTKQEKPMSKV